MGMTTKGSPEINVTPLIDVLLVLLIIFLVMIPVMTRMETIEIPPKEEGVISEKTPIVVKVGGDLSMRIDDAPPITAADLAGQLRPMLPTHNVVFLDVEDGVPWSEVVGTVDSVRGVASSLDLDVQVAVRVREEAPSQ